MNHKYLLIFGLLASTLAACGGESTPTTEQPAYVCQRTDAAEEDARCRVDDDCACGTHCSWGTCSAACSSDDDCADKQYCDSFGRCRAAGETSPTPAITAGNQASLTWMPSELALLPDGTAKQVRVFPSQSVDKIAVFASESTEVSCDAGASFSSSCTHDNVGEQVSSGVAVSVRLTSGATIDTETAETLTLATRYQEFSVGVSFVDDAPPEDPPPAGAGVYRGEAVLQASGLSSREPLPAEGDISSFRVPVEIRVEADGDAYVAELSDPVGLAFPGGDQPTLANLEATDEAWSLNSPTYLHVGSNTPGTDDVQITADLAASEVTWKGDSLSFVGTTRYYGVTLDESAPYVRWRVTVSREADLQGSLDAVPAPVELATPTADRAQVPVDAESSFAPSSAYANASSFVRAGVVVCSPAGTDQSTELIDSLIGNDVACEGPTTMKGMPVLDKSELAAGDTLQDCFYGMAPEFLPADEDASEIGACVDAGRLRAAIAVGLQDARARALGQLRQPPAQGTRLASYLLGHWLGVESFVARQYLDLERMNDVLPQEERIAMSLGITPAQLLGGLNGAWEVILHPRYGTAWGFAPELALTQPDYREEVVEDTLEPGPQQEPAPVVIARGVDAHLELTSSLISRVQFEEAKLEELRPQIGRAFRQSLISLALARGLVDDASVVGEPSWQQDWQVARDKMARSFKQATANLLDGETLLGVGPNDLPLYGIDDQESAAQRFLAVSRFLLGTGASGGVARIFVDRAEAELANARSAYTDFKTFEYRAVLNENEKDARLEAINRDYGGQIGSLCNPAWTSTEVLSFDDETLDPATCYLNEETALGQKCSFDQNEILERLTVGEVLTTMCIANKMLDRYGQTVASGDADFDRMLAGMPHNRLSHAAIEEARQDGKIKLTVDGWADASGRLIDLGELKSIISKARSAGSGDFGQQVRRECQQMYGESYGRPSQPPSSCEYSSDCPVGYGCDQGQCTPQLNDPADNAECYRGQLGQMALQLRATATDIDIARSELEEYSEQYDNAMRTCVITQLGNEKREDELKKHQSQMAYFSKIKLGAQVTANAAAGVKDCANSGGPTKFLTGSTYVACGAAAVEAAAKSVVDGMDYQMDTLERQHEATMMRIENEIDEQTCFNDAQAQLVGARSATLRIKRAQQELQQQLVEFEDMKTTVDGLVFEGRDALAREQSRTINPLAMDFFIDESIQAYDRYFTSARRAVFVAMLAVEYELQVSYSGRNDILGANTQAELDTALNDLTNIQLSERPQSASVPDNGLAVLSLKDDLLSIGDRSSFPEGYHHLSAEQRLQMVLNDPSNAVYDEEGNFEGVAIPFTLAPGGQADGGVPILSGRTCAERLWTVNASIQGDDLIRGSDTQIRQLELRKRNTFFSQWCGDGPEGEDYQVASVRPSRNLFVPPRAQDAVTDGSVTNLAGQAQEFAKASINSYINVSRTEIEDEAYFNGDSIALAGRGIFGDYQLFIPVDSLAMSAEDDGLVLNRVEDVLIRFDYVAALKN